MFAQSDVNHRGPCLEKVSAPQRGEGQGGRMTVIMSVKGP